MKNTDTEFNKFRITCLNCFGQDKKHDTLLYIHWEKRYYVITCYTCNTSEAFDEFTKKIDLSEKKEEDVKSPEIQKN